MLKFYNQIYSWFFREYSTLPIAIARIIWGSSLFFCYIFYYHDLELIFGREGVASFYHQIKTPKFAQEHIWLLYYILLSSALFFTLGLFSRFSGLVLLVCHALFIDITAYHTWGWSRLMVVFLLYAVLANCGAKLSLDQLIRKKFNLNVKNSVPAWPIRLLQIQICMIYFNSGWDRIDDIAWWKGEMVFEALAFSMYSRFPLVDWQDWKPLLYIGSWASWILELFAPVLLWIPKISQIFLIGLIIMHMMLEITATVGWWQFMMIGALVSFWKFEDKQTSYLS